MMEGGRDQEEDDEREGAEAEDGRVLWSDRYIFSMYYVLTSPYGCRLHLDSISGEPASQAELHPECCADHPNDSKH